MAISAVLVDFGGTLDSAGVHWSTQFARAFAACGIPVDRMTLDRAFMRSEEQIVHEPSIGTLDLASHVALQSGLIARELGLKATLAGAVTEAFLKPVRSHLGQARESIAHYRDRFTFGVVSNFSSNLPIILRQAGLSDLLSCTIVSETVGCRKPDARIFELALAELAATPHESAMVGDSLRSDIHGAKRVGLTTVWLRGDEAFGGGDPSMADHVATSLSDSLAWLATVSA
jgi:putative hydrolase of the HAD superfamily